MFNVFHLRQSEGSGTARHQQHHGTATHFNQCAIDYKIVL